VSSRAIVVDILGMHIFSELLESISVPIDLLSKTNEPQKEAYSITQI
jgi:hypothetical protein